MSVRFGSFKASAPLRHYAKNSTLQARGVENQCELLGRRRAGRKAIINLYAAEADFEAREAIGFITLEHWGKAIEANEKTGVVVLVGPNLVKDCGAA